MTTLSDFYSELESFDWYFEQSDDHTVWRRGSTRQAQLLAIARESPAHQALFEAWRRHMFTGTPWGNAQAPKPERPA